MRPRISRSGCVRPLVGPSVRWAVPGSVGWPVVHNAVEKIAENSAIQDEDESFFVYTVLLFFFFSLSSFFLDAPCISIGGSIGLLVHPRFYLSTKKTWSIKTSRDEVDLW